MKYSKSIMSMAAVFAISTSTIQADPTATYLPLTTKANDKAWIMFGVNDFSNGVRTDTLLANGSFNPAYSSATEDSTTDDLATPQGSTVSFPSSDATPKNMASFQALLDGGGTEYFTDLEIALRSTDLAFSQTSPVRSMYIAIEGAESVSKIKLTYKADLEGREVELKINAVSGVVYRTNINQAATFSNPAVAKNIDAPGTATPPDITKIDDVLSYDLSDAPIIPVAYHKADHHFDNDVNASEGSERFYYYDAVAQIWQIWDRAKTGTSANTITDFEKGKAYWGRMDLASTDGGSDTNTTSRNKAGLVLGKTGLHEANSSIYGSNLTSGWNMLALDPATNSDIRSSMTGLKVTITSFARNESLVLVDETGVNEHNVTFSINTNATDSNGSNAASQVNISLEAAKALGIGERTLRRKLNNC